jgi:copper chaperone CopZ
MTTVFRVGGMSCQHCVDAVTKAVTAAIPGATIKVDLAAGTATIDQDIEAGDDAALRDAIESAGFEYLGRA